MFAWKRFDVVIADECSSGSISMLLLLMSVRLAAFLSCFFLVSARLAVFRCWDCYWVLVWCCFLVVIADECSSGRFSLFLLLMRARLAACRCSYD